MRYWTDRWVFTIAGVLIAPFCAANPSSHAQLAELVSYFDGYKYALSEDYEHRLSFDSEASILSGKIELEGDLLILRSGFGWDGASGPAIDTKDSLRASAVHDALWQLMDERMLDPELYKRLVDYEFSKILEEDGVPVVIRWAMHRAVRSYGVRESRHDDSLFERIRSMNARVRRLLQAGQLSLRAAVFNRPIEAMMNRPYPIAFSEL